MQQPSSSNVSVPISALIIKALNPPIVGTVILGVVSLTSTSSWEEFLMWWLTSIGAIVFVPLALVLWGVHKGKFSDLNLSKREQRVWPYLGGLVSIIPAIIAMLLLCAPKEVLLVSLVQLVGLLVLLALTRWWKASFHTATISGGTLVMVIQFGLPAIPLLILIPLVGWTRIKIGAHSRWDVILGGLIGALAVVIVFGLGTYVI